MDYKVIDGNVAYRYDLEDATIGIAIKRYEMATRFMQEGTALDIGCAYGIGVNTLHWCGFKTVGIDIDEDVIKTAKDCYPQYRFNVEDGSKLNINGDYDNYVVLDSLQHFNDSISTLKRWKEQLDDKTLVVTTLNKPIMDSENLELNPGAVTKEDVINIFPNAELFSFLSEVNNRFWFVINRGDGI